MLKPYELKIYSPEFDSNLTDLVIELEHLRKKTLAGTTHTLIFNQIKHIFHMLESIGSARIEGNNTTISEYIESKLDNETVASENINEILNNEKAMQFIDDVIEDAPINRMFVSDLHKLVISGLTKEGSRTLGQYRQINVDISGSGHTPPDALELPFYMEELFNFINREDKEKYDLLKTAIAHHRFAWIHPFDNGNGRTVRLLTYAMLVKQGFNIKEGRIINPTAVFCSSREKYYNALAMADTGTSDGILSWCEFVLSGLKEEIQKIDNLLDYDYLLNNILLPALSLARVRQNITEREEKILKIAVSKQVFASSDIESLFKGKAHTERSRVLRKLRGNKMIAPETEGARRYVIQFHNNYLLRSIIEVLGNNGFLPMDN